MWLVLVSRRVLVELLERVDPQEYRYSNSLFCLDYKRPLIFLRDSKVCLPREQVRNFPPPRRGDARREAEIFFLLNVRKSLSTILSLLGSERFY